MVRNGVGDANGYLPSGLTSPSARATGGRDDQNRTRRTLARDDALGLLVGVRWSVKVFAALIGLYTGQQRLRLKVLSKQMTAQTCSGDKSSSGALTWCDEP